MTAPSIDAALIPAALRPLVQAIARGGAALADSLRRSCGTGCLSTDPDRIFRDRLAGAGVRWYLSKGTPREIQREGPFALVINPLQGSPDLGINATVGTSFAVFPAAADPDTSFLRQACDLIAGGYILYGPGCCMMLSFGDGTRLYALNPDSHGFELRDGQLTVPAQPRTRDVAPPDTTRVHRADSDRAASVVAEAHRVLMRGGAARFSADTIRPGLHSPRLLHDCAPIALLIEQAGGLATDATRAILDRRIASLQQRTEFAFGRAEDLDHGARRQHATAREIPALFGHRGLFRA